MAEFTSDLAEPSAQTHAPMTLGVQNFLKGSHSLNTRLLNCRSLQRDAFCAVICQRVSLQVTTACMRLPVHKAFSHFPEQAKGYVLWFPSPCSFRVFGKEPLTHLSTGNRGQCLNAPMESRAWRLRFDPHTYK